MRIETPLQLTHYGRGLPSRNIMGSQPVSFTVDAVDFYYDGAGGRHVARSGYNGYLARQVDGASSTQRRITLILRAAPLCAQRIDQLEAQGALWAEPGTEGYFAA